MSKTIKYWILPCIIPSFISIGGRSDLFLDMEELFNWMANTENQYNKVTARIDKWVVKGKGWKLYCWYDISGFGYWKKQNDSNYVQISIIFDTENILISQINKIELGLDRLIKKCNTLTDKLW